ncbi:MAG: T9SS type A sorting domain-containing protein [Bacteroidales bacterium]
MKIFNPTARNPFLNKWTLRASALALVSIISFESYSSTPIAKELFNYTSDYDKNLENWIKISDREHKNSILITEDNVQLSQKGNTISSITADTLTINMPLKDAQLSFNSSVNGDIPLELNIDGRDVSIGTIDNEANISTTFVGDVSSHLTIKTNEKKSPVHLTNIKLTGRYYEAEVTETSVSEDNEYINISWNKSISTPRGKYARERVELMNEEGITVLSSDINDSNTNFNTYSFNTQTLTPGEYFVRVVTTDEDDTLITRAISEVTPLGVFGSVKNFNYKITGQYIKATWENLTTNPTHRLVIFDMTPFEKVRISELTSGEEAILPISQLDESALNYYIGLETLDSKGKFSASIGRLDLKIINKGDTIVEAGSKITLSPPARTIWRYNCVTIKMRSDEIDGSEILTSGGAIPLSGEIIKQGEGGITFKNATIDMDLYRYRRYHFNFPFIPDMIRVDNQETEAKVMSDFNISFYDNLARSEGATSYYKSVTLNSEGENPYNEFIPGEGLQLAIDGEPNTRVRTNFKISAEETINNFDFLTYSLVKSKPSFYNVNSTNPIINGWNYIGSPFPKKTVAGGVRQAYVYDGKAYKLYGPGLENKEIPTLASFFVQTTESDKTITFELDTFLVSDQTTTLANLSSYTKQQDNTPKYIRLSVNDNIYEDVMLFKEAVETQQFYSIGNDLTKMFATDASIPQIYTKVGSSSVVLRSIDMGAMQKGVDFWVKCGRNGEHTLSLPLNEWSEEFDYNIKDSNGNIYNLKDNNYSFDGVKGQTVKLTLIATPIIPMSDLSPEENDTKVYSYDKEIIVNTKDVINSIRVTDLSGRIVDSIQPEANNINIKVSGSGIYIVEVTTGSSRKIYKVALN